MYTRLAARLAAALVTTTLAFAVVRARAQDCDVARGERVFANCAICHSRQAKVPSPAGPNLSGVVGRKAASLPGFKYSRALRESAKTWSPEQLDLFLKAPQTAVPGTAMAFAGLRNPEDRAAVICLLATPQN
jgi:cytochrome c